jgi:hypothetical protein
MRLTWKDAIATVLTAAIATTYAAFLGGTTLPLVSSPRALAAVFLVVGLTACAIGGTARCGSWRRHDTPSPDRSTPTTNFSQDT